MFLTWRVKLEPKHRAKRDADAVPRQIIGRLGRDAAALQPEDVSEPWFHGHLFQLYKPIRCKRGSIYLRVQANDGHQP